MHIKLESCLAILIALLATLYTSASAHAIKRTKNSWSPWSSPLSPASPPALPNVPLSNITIYDFGFGVWPENLSVRSNGQILVTIVNKPEVWQINPFNQQDAVLVHSFSGKQSCFAIVETYPDIFHLIVGDFYTTPAFSGTTGSYGIWELDFTARSVNSTSLATVSHIVDIPTAGILDGMDILNAELGLLVVGDAEYGVIYIVNVKTKIATPTITTDLFNSTAALPVGVDGLRLLGSTLFFTNAIQGLFGSVPINLTSGHPTSPPSILPISHLLPTGPLDDLIFDDIGNAFITKSELGIYYVPAPVISTTNFSFVTNITGPTACRFGRTEWDKGSLYVTSTGGVFSYPSQNYTVTSKLSRVDVYY